jgi:tetratricopeptide (TPR) repeat protein
MKNKPFVLLIILIFNLVFASCSKVYEFDHSEIPKYNNMFLTGKLPNSVLDSLYDVYHDDYFLSLYILTHPNDLEKILEEISKLEQYSTLPTFTLSSLFSVNWMRSQQYSSSKHLEYGFIRSIKLDSLEENIFARYGLSKVYNVQGESKKELEVLLQAADIEPDNPMINASLCKYYLLRSNMSEVEYYISQLDPKRRRYIGLQAQIAENDGNIDEAHKLYDSSFKMKITYEIANSFFKFLLNNRFYNELEKTLVTFHEKDTGYYKYYYYQAKLFILKNDTTSALDSYKKAFEINKYDSDVEVGYLQLLLDLGRVKDAYNINTNSRAISYRGNAYYILLKELLKKNKLDLSYVTYRHVFINTDPSNIKKYDKNGKYLDSLLSSFNIDKTRFNKMIENKIIIDFKKRKDPHETETH